MAVRRPRPSAAVRKAEKKLQRNPALAWVHAQLSSTDLGLEEAFVPGGVSHLAKACQLIFQAEGNVVDRGFTSVTPQEKGKNSIFTRDVEWSKTLNFSESARSWQSYTNQFGCKQLMQYYQ